MNTFIKLLVAVGNQGGSKILCRNTDYGLELPKSEVFDNPDDLAKLLWSHTTGLSPEWAIIQKKTWKYHDGAVQLVYGVVLPDTTYLKSPYYWKSLAEINDRGMNDLDSQIIQEVLPTF
jgi:hypothetical protein